MEVLGELSLTKLNASEMVQRLVSHSLDGSVIDFKASVWLRLYFAI